MSELVRLADGVKLKKSKGRRDESGDAAGSNPDGGAKNKVAPIPVFNRSFGEAGGASGIASRHFAAGMSSH